MAIIGPDGFMLYSNLSKTNERVYLGDREHFQVHNTTGGDDRLFISKPLTGKVSEKSSLYNSPGRFSTTVDSAVSSYCP